MRQPKVSVCIPTYRGAATLGAAIASVLAQSMADFELVVLDDNSPDNTADVVAGFADGRIRYLRNPANLGPEGNWNRCLTEARGAYVKVLPHDDLLASDCLRQQAEVLDRDQAQAIALVFSARHVIGPDGQRLMTRGYPGGQAGTLAARDIVRACARRGTNLVGEPGAVLFRKALAEQVGPFDAQQPYLIDLDYWLRLLKFGDASYSPEPLASFRVSASQWSVALVGQQGSDFRRCLARHTTRDSLGLGPVDRLLAAVTPGLNGLARQVFYKLYLR